MKRSLLACLCLIALAGPATAMKANQPGHFGLGLIVGEPTGLSGKYVITDLIAVQGALGFSLFEKGFWLGADVLFQFRNVFTKDGKWPLYIGGGLVIQDRYRNKNIYRETSLGLRAVVGVEFLAADQVSIFGEISVQPFIIPGIDFGLGLGIGARYWF